MADPELLRQLPQLPIHLPEPPERCRTLWSRWVSKFTGGTASTRGYMLSLCGMLAVLIVMGQIFHLAAPRAKDPQEVGRPPAAPQQPNAPPASPPSPQPLMPLWLPPLPPTVPPAPPSPPSRPYPPSPPPTPPAPPGPPPNGPPPAPPPWQWWQRRLPLSTELVIAQWELVCLILCCVITPILVVGRRNYVRWREGQRDIIRRRSSAMAYNRTRQQQQSSGEISPSHSPGGPVGAPKGGGRRGSRLMGVEVAPEGGLALSGRVLP